MDMVNMRTLTILAALGVALAQAGTLAADGCEMTPSCPGEMSTPTTGDCWAAP